MNTINNGRKRVSPEPTDEEDELTQELLNMAQQQQPPETFPSLPPLENEEQEVKQGPLCSDCKKPIDHDKPEQKLCSACIKNLENSMDAEESEVKQPATVWALLNANGVSNKLAKIDPDNRLGLSGNEVKDLSAMAALFFNYHSTYPAFINVSPNVSVRSSQAEDTHTGQMRTFTNVGIYGPSQFFNSGIPHRGGFLISFPLGVYKELATLPFGTLDRKQIAPKFGEYYGIQLGGGISCNTSIRTGSDWVTGLNTVADSIFKWFHTKIDGPVAQAWLKFKGFDPNTPLQNLWQSAAGTVFWKHRLMKKFDKDTCLAYPNAIKERDEILLQKLGRDTDPESWLRRVKELTWNRFLYNEKSIYTHLLCPFNMFRPAMATDFPDPEHPPTQDDLRKLVPITDWKQQYALTYKNTTAIFQTVVVVDTISNTLITAEKPISLHHVNTRLYALVYFGQYEWYDALGAGSAVSILKTMLDIFYKAKLPEAISLDEGWDLTPDIQIATQAEEELVEYEKKVKKHKQENKHVEL